MNIAVHPGRRRKGLGRLLLGRMIEFAKSKMIRVVWLEVRPSNVTARKLYEKMGFTETGRRPRYYTDTKEDAVIMCLPLYLIDTDWSGASESSDSQLFLIGFEKT